MNANTEHTETVSALISKVDVDSWHWSSKYSDEIPALTSAERDFVLDQVAAHAATLQVGQGGSFEIQFPVTDPAVVREQNRQRAFAELKSFNEDVERALRGLCDAEGRGFISPSMAPWQVFDAISADIWCGTLPLNAVPDYRDRVIKTALDAYLCQLVPGPEEF